ncbi:MAG TPA: UDP-N-acetylglucosamine 2-epimerase (non-hydrolyzing) [Nitrospiria bacterium]
MKILTLLGTRPEIIRLSLIMKSLDEVCDHVLVHSGQNFEPTLSDVFFKDLAIRRPNYYLGVRGSSFGEQLAKILVESEKVLTKEKPDRFLILGDTNSGLSALVAKRLGIRVFHMEAGNRCFDDRVPEEINRRTIDHCSDILMPYTERSRANLLREGIPGHRIFVTGNPIFEVIRFYDSKIQRSPILGNLGLTSGGYFLVTTHRAENVDVESRLRSLFKGLDQLQREYQVPIILSAHPRLKDRVKQFGFQNQNEKIHFHSPFSFFDFIALERQALCVLSDSGTVQEECSILKVPNVTIRDTTERPETIETGSGILSGVEPDRILACVKVSLYQKGKGLPPEEYTRENVSSTVVKILLGAEGEKGE